MREINKAILFTRKNIGLCEKIEEHRNQNKIPVPETACIEWETILAALEKQIPKSPLDQEVNRSGDLIGICSVCNRRWVNRYQKYCAECGQKLEWNENPEMLKESELIE